MAETRAGVTMSIRGRFVEISAASLLDRALAMGEVQLTLARDAQVLMRGFTSDHQVVIGSDIFDEISEIGREYVNGACNCNCNCNCGGGVSNCNCNCNCACVQSEEYVAKDRAFRRPVLER